MKQHPGRAVRCCACLLIFWATASSSLGFGQDATAKPATLDLYGEPLPEGAIARLGALRFHHPAGLIDLAFSPDGKTILTVGQGMFKLTARLWDTATGKERSRFAVDHASLRQVCFHPDGRTVVLNVQNSVELYDSQTGKHLRTFGGEKEILSCALSPDGKLLATGSMEWKDDNPIRVWEVETGRELQPFAGQGVNLYALTFSADGKRLCCGPLGQYQTRDKVLPSALCVWDVATRKKLAQIKCSKSEVAFARNGEFVAFDDAGGVCVVAVATAKTVCRIVAKNPSLAWTPDSKALVVLDEDRNLSLWDSTTSRLIRRFEGHISQESRLGSLSPDGRLLALMDDGRCARAVRSACGTWPAARKSAPSPPMRMPSVTWLSLRTANGSPRPGLTEPCASGTRRPARSCIASPGIVPRCPLWCSLPTARRWPPQATTGPRTSGISPVAASWLSLSCRWARSRGSPVVPRWSIPPMARRSPRCWRTEWWRPGTGVPKRRSSTSRSSPTSPLPLSRLLSRARSWLPAARPGLVMSRGPKRCISGTWTRARSCGPCCCAPVETKTVESSVVLLRHRLTAGCSPPARPWRPGQSGFTTATLRFASGKP